MRQLIATAILFAAATAQAASLTLPASPGASATVTLNNGSSSIPLSIPPDYPFIHNPLFGHGGDADDAFTVIGAPETGSTGAAFVFDTQTGEYLRQLVPPPLLQGGLNGPQFGYDVLMYRGLAVVSAPNAGGPALTQNPGRVYLYDPATGERLQTIAGIGTHWGLGQNLLELNGLPYASRVSETTGAVRNVLLSLINVPEPGAMMLALLGVATVCCRRRC